MLLRDDEFRVLGPWPARLTHAASGRHRDIDKGMLLVPSNRTRSDSAALALPFVRLRSKRDYGLPPLVMLAGGPGAAAIGAFEGSFFDHADRLSEVCDVVTFDQRGCQRALPDLANPWTPPYDLTIPLDRTGFLAAHRENAKRLAAHYAEVGVNLNDFNTVQSAHDVDDLRQALGAETINLHGASYGSHLGLTTLREHGDRVSQAILCIVEGLDDTHKLPSNTDRHFHYVADLAREDPNLGGEFGDLYGELATVFEEFEETPESIEVSGCGQPVPIGKFGLQLMLGSMLGSVRAIKGLPKLVRQLAQRDLRDSSIRLSRWLTDPGKHAMMLSMDFASGATPERMRRIEAERHHALLDDSFNLPFPFVGDALGVNDLGNDFRKPVTTHIPTLFCAGTLDGRTPISNAEAVRKGFERSQLVIVEGASHQVPDVLIEPEICFLLNQDIGSEHLSVPFAFDPL